MDPAAGMEGFGIAILVAFGGAVLAAIVVSSLLVTAVVKLVRRRPSGRLGVVIVMLAGAFLAPLGVVHVILSRRARERAFLDVEPANE